MGQASAYEVGVPSCSEFSHLALLFALIQMILATYVLAFSTYYFLADCHTDKCICRWEKYQSEEEAALGRGKRLRKAVSYREAYAPHTSGPVAEVTVLLKASFFDCEYLCQCQ